MNTLNIKSIFPETLSNFNYLHYDLTLILRIMWYNRYCTKPISKAIAYSNENINIGGSIWEKEYSLLMMPLSCV